MTVVFTDLDGTLLDPNTGSFEAAIPALRALDRLAIPVIFATSKTRAEVEEIRRRCGNLHPFIVENGGAVFIPRSYFPFAWRADRVVDGYDVAEFGRPYSEVVAALCEASLESACPVRAFHSMSAAEVASGCGLTPDEAGRARAREYDEPFQILEAERQPVLLTVIERRGWRCTRGDAWYHLTADNDKALAASTLLAAFRLVHGSVYTIALGDSPNDAELLSIADTAFIVRSRLAAALKVLVPGAHMTTLSGAAAWNKAVLDWLRGNPALSS